MRAAAATFGGRTDGAEDEAGAEGVEAGGGAKSGEIMTVGAVADGMVRSLVPSALNGMTVYAANAASFETLLL